jgi:hypothetical protein
MLEANLAALNQEHVDVLVRDIPHGFSTAVLTSFGMLNDRMSSFDHDYKMRSSKASSCVTSFCAFTYYL